MLHQGDTFRIRGDEHVYIIISSPQKCPQTIYVANFTHWERNRDQSCVLGPGDHGALYKKTVVYYNNPSMESEAAIEAKIKRGKYIRQNPVRRDILNRILAGAAKSKKVPHKCRRLLEEQGLILSPKK